MQDSAPSGAGRRHEVRREVRPAAPHEHGAVADLLVAVFTPIAARMPPDIAARYLDEVRDVQSRSAISELLVVADGGGQLTGAVTFLPDSAADDHPWPAGGAVLRLLAVAPSARSRGAGRALVDDCVDRARALARGFVGLHTAPLMDDARRLYEHLGFIRAPAWDFDAGVYYGSGPNGEDHVRGLAYVLPLD